MDMNKYMRLHRQALLANADVLRELSVKQLAPEELIDAGYLRAVSAAVWLYLKVGNTKMACHKIHNACQRLLHLFLPGTRIEVIGEAVVKLHSEIERSCRGNDWSSFVHAVKVVGLLSDTFVLPKVPQPRQNPYTMDGREALVNTLMTPTGGMVVEEVDTNEESELNDNDNLSSLTNTIVRRTKTLHRVLRIWRRQRRQEDTQEIPISTVNSWKDVMDHADPSHWLLLGCLQSTRRNQTIEEGAENTNQPVGATATMDDDPTFDAFVSFHTALQLLPTKDSFLTLSVQRGMS